MVLALNAFAIAMIAGYFRRCLARLQISPDLKTRAPESGSGGEVLRNGLHILLGRLLLAKPAALEMSFLIGVV